MSIDYVKAGPVATFTLRNGKVNPLTDEMHRRMHEALIDFMADPELKVGILSGAGGRAFSAGDDMGTEDPVTGDAVADLLTALSPAHVAAGTDSLEWADDVLRIHRTKPIIGAVRGWCLGRGLECLLRLTDIRIATPDAKFGLPEVAYGMAGLAGTMQLTRHLTATTAWEMALTAEPIDAAEARRRSEDLSPDDAYALGTHLYRMQRLALGESDVQDTILNKR